MTGFIGILSLDSRFPRIKGDAGNPDSYDLPARVRVIEGADSPKIVQDGRPAPELAARFIEAARELEAEGAIFITSTCGFLVSMQHEIARAVRVPVMLSALSLLPLLRLADRKAVFGILTASAASLGPGALKAAGVKPEDVRIRGLDHVPIFAGTFLAAKEAQPDRFDRAAMEAAVTEAARGLIEAHPEVTLILLECGNLPPYAAAIAQATGRPVQSILDGVRLFT